MWLGLQLNSSAVRVDAPAGDLAELAHRPAEDRLRLPWNEMRRLRRTPSLRAETLQLTQKIRPLGHCSKPRMARQSERKEQHMSEMVPFGGGLAKRESRRVGRELARMSGEAGSSWPRSI